MKYAKISDGVVKVIKIDTPRKPENWVEVPDTVFAGFIANADGTYSAPTVPAKTPQELDDMAELEARLLLQDNPQMKALGMVLADVVAQAFNLSDAQARNQVRTRFRDYYRQLIEDE